MNKVAQITILMAVHNPDEKFFVEQVESLMAQDFSDWVCVVSDDSGSKEVSEFVKKVLQGDDRFYYVESKKQQGVTFNFENAYEHAQGFVTDYYCFCDQDDIWLPSKLSQLVSILEKRSDVSLLHSDAKLINDKSIVTSDSLWASEGRNISMNSFFDLVLKNNVTGCTLICRKSVFELAYPFPSELAEAQILHDHWVAICASVIGEIQGVKDCLVLYRQHTGNIVGASQRKSLLDIAKNYNEIKWQKKVKFKKVLSFLKKISARSPLFTEQFNNLKPFIWSSIFKYIVSFDYIRLYNGCALRRQVGEIVPERRKR